MLLHNAEEFLLTIDANKKWPFEKAKQLFITELGKQKKAYEDQLAKPWYECFFKPSVSDYGAEDYSRTLDFLDKLEKPSITCTEHIIWLTAKVEFQHGNNFLGILHTLTLIIVGVTECQLSEAMEKLRSKLVNEGYARTPGYALMLYTLREQVIRRSYQQLINIYQFDVAAEEANFELKAMVNGI